MKEYFYYTRSERNGALVLIFICLFLFAIPSFYPLIFPQKESMDFSAFQEMLPSPSSVAEKAGLHSTSRNAPAMQEVSLFKFDPNTATKEELVRLGLLPRVAQTVLNYRSKGGKFHKKEDLKKIYGLSEEEYAELEPWIRIAPSVPAKSASPRAALVNERKDTAAVVTTKTKAWKSYPAKYLPPPEIDINQATPEEWQLLRGIGPGYSKRIVNFRNKLGGFYTIEQVADTYGLPDSTFKKIKPYLRLSPIFRKININTATLQELKMHPYLSNFQATVLFNYRRQHGNFNNMESLKGVKVAFTDSDWERLEPYLVFE